MTFTYIKMHTDIKMATIFELFTNKVDPPQKKTPVQEIGWFKELMPLGLKKSKRFGEYIWQKDNSIMLYVSKGFFVRGSTKDTNAKPVREIYLSGYYIDKYELSNQKYKAFVDATKYKKPKYASHKKLGAKRHPVVGISWFDAQKYAEWVGKQLPSEAQWEKAAKGGIKIGRPGDTRINYSKNRYPQRAFPWGIKLDKRIVQQGKSKKDYTTPVSSFLDGRSPYGCHNMLGNVAEWCQDSYQKNYYSKSPSKNPTGPQKAMELRVYRGGFWGNKHNIYTHTRRAMPAKSHKIFMGVRYIVPGTKNE